MYKKSSTNDTERASPGLSALLMESYIDQLSEKQLTRFSRGYQERFDIEADNMEPSAGQGHATHMPPLPLAWRRHPSFRAEEDRGG